MPNENVLPLHSNAVDDEDTDVGMHIIDGGDNDEEESDEQSECLPFSEIFTGSIYSVFIQKTEDSKVSIPFTA